MITTYYYYYQLFHYFGGLWVRLHETLSRALD